MSVPTGLPPARQAVLDLIRRGERTVNALAERLRISDNAVRLHLVALERDGLLRKSGMVRSGSAGQPAVEYVITPEGEQALSSAYPAALAALAAAAGERLDPRTRRALFLDAGRNLAVTMSGRDAGSLQERAERCAELIDSLGGRAELATSRGSVILQGAGCPLASAVRAEPATCYLIESLLETHTGVKAEQLCDHGDRPACRFRLTSS